MIVEHIFCFVKGGDARVRRWRESAELRERWAAEDAREGEEGSQVAARAGLQEALRLVRKVGDTPAAQRELNELEALDDMEGRHW